MTSQGAIPPHAYGFDIKLQCGPKPYPYGDIALQISARLLNGYISLNSSEKGIWRKEIRLSTVPIEGEQKFKISVLSEVNQYKVVINDEHYCLFPQRIPCEKVSHLSIDGDVSITRISHESNSNSISDSKTPLASTKNQFNNVKHLDLPPSYGTAMTSCKDVESQNKRIADIAIFNFRYNRGSPVKATLKSGSKTFFTFLSVIPAIILFGYFIIFTAQYANNNTGDTSYSTYSIPSIDLEAVNQDMEKNFKLDEDVMASQKKLDEENKIFNDILANAKKTEKDTKYLSDLVQTSTLNVRNNKSPDLLDQVSKEFNDLLAKAKQN